MKRLLAGVGLIVGCGTEPGPGAAEPADLAPLPEAGCPDMGASVDTEVTIAGNVRSFTLRVPQNPKEGMGLLYAFHGLTEPSFQPVQQIDQAFDMQRVADTYNVAIVIPEALEFDLFAFPVLLWSILDNEGTAEDLALFDGLRSCLADRHSDIVDLGRVYTWGHSGGGLWSSLLVMERSDVLAAAAISAGGVDVEIPLIGEVLPYQTPAKQTPTLIVDGGDGDLWPNELLTLIDFAAISDNLESSLVADGHTVVHCRHEFGHGPGPGFPSWYWDFTLEWLDGHRFGEPSPWAEGGQALEIDECWFPGR